MLKGAETKYKFEHPNPFIGEEEEGEVASVAYRYRKWDLDNGIVSKNNIIFKMFCNNMCLIKLIKF